MGDARSRSASPLSNSGTDLVPNAFESVTSRDVGQPLQACPEELWETDGLREDCVEQFIIEPKVEDDGDEDDIDVDEGYGE